MTGANAALATAIAAAQVPFAVRLLGDSWPASARISISPRGIISRGLQSASTIVDPVLPIPRRTVAGDWADGTIAPYLDPRFEARDGTSRILTKAFDAGLPTERFVVEWNNFTTGVDFKPRLPLSLRIQAVIFADGSFEFRYPPLPDPSTSTPLGDGAFLRGQGASIGLASSGGATVLVSQHMEALDPSGTTFRFVPTTQLPAEGRGLLVVPSNAPSALVVDLTGSNGASARQALTVREAYATPSSSTMGFMSIRQTPGVRALAFGSDAALPLEVPFPLQVFGEKWQSLAVFRAATVGPWGASVIGMTGGTNFDAAPFPKPVSPNGFVAGLYAANGSSWCTASGVPTVYASIREDTSPKTVTLEWPGLQRCGAQMRGTVDVQVTIRADGSVSVHHGNVSPGATVTEQTLFVGLENGAGTLAVTEAITTSGGSPLPDNRVFTFTRP
jgi:hypothetical protein